MKYTYSKANDTVNGSCDTYILEQAIIHSGITTTINYIKAYDDVIELDFLVALPAVELTELNTLVSNHSSDPLFVYKTIVQNALEFFNTTMVKFAAENITMGITVYGKTKEVADYLADVMRYGQSGSLYEVASKVDELIAAGVPTTVAPFVTEARLNSLKAEVTEYLGG